jgi:NADH-quinone oxidoreductase subunit J
MAEVFFFLAAIGAVAGAAGTVLLRDAFYSVLSLVSHLIFLAMLFLLLRAEFVAAAQVIVYAGAVMVLYVFVVSYVGGMEAGLAGPTGRGMRILSVLFAFALFVELSIALIGSGIAALGTEGADYTPLTEAQRAGGESGFGEPKLVGELFLTDYLVAFEVASLLLLIAAVGAVILARRRTGAADAREISVTELMGKRSITESDDTQATMLGAGGPRPK